MFQVLGKRLLILPTPEETKQGFGGILFPVKHKGFLREGTVITCGPAVPDKFSRKELLMVYDERKVDFLLHDGKKYVVGLCEDIVAVFE